MRRSSVAIAGVLGLFVASTAPAQYGPVERSSEACNRLEALAMTVHNMQLLGPDERSASNLVRMSERLETDRRAFVETLDDQGAAGSELADEVRALEADIEELSGELSLGEASEGLSDQYEEVEASIRNVYEELDCSY